MLAGAAMLQEGIGSIYAGLLADAFAALGSSWPRITVEDEFDDSGVGGELVREGGHLCFAEAA